MKFFIKKIYNVKSFRISEVYIEVDRRINMTFILALLENEFILGRRERFATFQA